MEKAAQSGMTAEIAMNLFAYDCPASRQPEIPAEGGLYRCAMADVEEAAEMVTGFYTDIEDEVPSLQDRVDKMKSYIEGNALFFWKNGSGKTVACCSYTINDRLASLSNVYTFPEERRKHYAQNLVYQVTRIVSDMGYTPMLYTDADYSASNACYEKIGYILRGKLCTLALKK